VEYKLSYLLESFPSAARHLATGEGDVKERIELAYGYSSVPTLLEQTQLVTGVAAVGVGVGARK